MYNVNKQSPQAAWKCRKIFEIMEIWAEKLDVNYWHNYETVKMCEYMHTFTSIRTPTITIEWQEKWRCVSFVLWLSWSERHYFYPLPKPSVSISIFFCHAMQPSLVFHIVPSSNYIQFLIFTLRDKKNCINEGWHFFIIEWRSKGSGQLFIQILKWWAQFFFDLIKCILAKLSMPKGSKMWNKSDVAQKKGVEKNVSVSLSIAPIDFWMTCNEYDVFFFCSWFLCGNFTGKRVRTFFVAKI